MGPRARRAGAARREYCGSRVSAGRHGCGGPGPGPGRAFASTCEKGTKVTESAAVLCAFCILTGSGSVAGLALINTGLGRSRNAAHALLAALCAAATAAIVYAICGFA